MEGSAGESSVPGLRARLLGALAPLAAGRPAWGLLDFPDHWNIGDSAIWAGEVALLGGLHGGRAAYVSHVRYPVAEIDRLMPADGVIWLHGGGNFGDIWPVYQDYREAVLAQTRGRRVVQLPQTLHFGRPEPVERMKRLIGAHGDFHLMVRDRPSEDFARREFDCAVILAPDAAFGIDMAAIPRDPAPRGVLALLRTDKERREDARGVEALFGGGQDWRTADWAQPARLRRDGERALRRAFEYLPLRPAMPWRERAFAAFAQARIARGFAQLDAAQVVVTDRLHGHIMARLLGKPQVVIDNFYGKIAGFMGAFGGGGALQARDYAEARDMAAGLLAQARAAQ
jgi:pyruvyl transferase EpsO